jgi:hypothetical protein
MTTHALALTNLLTFLLEHHAEDIVFVTYNGACSVVVLRSPPKGRTMLGWEWNPSDIRGRMAHTTASGITVFAPDSEVSA